MMDLGLAGSPQVVNIIVSVQRGQRQARLLIFNCPLPPLPYGSGKVLKEIQRVSGITLSSEIHYQGRSMLILSIHIPDRSKGFSGLIQGLISYSTQSNDLACSRGSSGIAKVQALAQALVVYSSLSPV